jgi:superfamily II DNA/RNA helicase
MLFSSLGLAPELQQAINACGYTQMTPVQEKAIAPARRGQDILANAQTGTGKTAAFALPILQQMIERPKAVQAGRPRALILTPTRELAEQLAETIGAYAKFLPLKVVAVYGGAKITAQQAKLKAGVDILIATPGRLLEHITQCNLDLASVDFVVLDEADRMLDMGFISDVKQLLQYTPKTRQTSLFSATISPSVNTLAKEILTNHQELRITRHNVTADTITHVMYPVEERRKIELFMQLLEEQNWFQVLVFTSTKEQADSLLYKLQEQNVDAAVCHGDKSQGARRRALSEFKSGKLQVLIATEVAARGLDIQGLEFVINYNLPYLAEDYVHRIGRTGRAGKPGTAISFVSREEERTLETIQRLIGSTIRRVHKRGFEVSDRSTLLKNLKASTKPGRTNKSTSSKSVRARGNTTGNIKLEKANPKKAKAKNKSGAAKKR